VIFADLFLYGIRSVVAGLLLIACLTGMMRQETVVDYFRTTFEYYLETLWKIKRLNRASWPPD